MRTLREYLERNNYSIVKSLAEMLSISPEEATDFYKSISSFDEGKVVAALKDGADAEDVNFVKNLFQEYQSVDESVEEKKPRFTIETGSNGQYEIWDNKQNKIVDTAHSGHEAHNLLYWHKQEAKKEVDEAKDSKPNLSQLAGKAKAGGYDPARELSKGQFQHRIVQDKKKKNDRKDSKAQLKRGMFENTVVPVLINDEDGYKFKIVESSLIAEMKNVEALFESSIVISPVGGLTAIPGVGMNGLRKMSGLSPIESEAQQDEITELESPDLNQILSIIDYMDETSKACLISMLTNPEQTTEPQIDAEQLAMVKTALCDFGSALQSWIEGANGGLDFLCPLVDALWVKYNEI